MIIFISGSINSGKSTVSKILTKKLPKTALVEIDVLREFIDWMPIDQAIPINLQNAAAVIKNFVNHELNVVAPYPLSKENYEYLKSCLEDLHQNMYVFTLNPGIEKVLFDRGERELADWEKERIKYHYKIGINNPGFGTIIDNSLQTPEETAKEILKYIS